MDMTPLRPQVPLRIRHPFDDIFQQLTLAIRVRQDNASFSHNESIRDGVWGEARSLVALLLTDKAVYIAGRFMHLSHLLHGVRSTSSGDLIILETHPRITVRPFRKSRKASFCRELDAVRGAQPS